MGNKTCLKCAIADRLRDIAESIGYDDELLDVARPDHFDLDSREAKKLISELEREIEDAIKLGCTEAFAFDSAFCKYKDEIRVFFRVFEEGDVLRLKLKDGTEFICQVCGIEEMYSAELDGSFFDECFPGRDVPPSDETDVPVDLRLWFEVYPSGDLAACLFSSILGVSPCCFRRVDD